MASDSMPGMPLQHGSNFSVVVQCETSAELEKLLAGMAEEAKVVLTLQDTFWGGRFGMLTNQFGIDWKFKFRKE
jgi:PhnB protein